MMIDRINLRDYKIGDLKFYFEFQRDRTANYTAAFTLKNPDSWTEFRDHWDRILNDDEIIVKSITFNEKVIGNILSFVLDNEREVSYWIDKNYWGRGVATNALKTFLLEYKLRPLYARTAFDNIGSIRVLEKCGFVKIGEGKYFANARNKEIVEDIFLLK